MQARSMVVPKQALNALAQLLAEAGDIEAACKHALALAQPAREGGHHDAPWRTQLAPNTIRTVVMSCTTSAQLQQAAALVQKVQSSRPGGLPAKVHRAMVHAAAGVGEVQFGLRVLRWMNSQHTPIDVVSNTHTHSRGCWFRVC